MSPEVSSDALPMGPFTAGESHRFNLSAWALRHQPLVIFILALLTLFGMHPTAASRSPRIRRSPSR